MKHVLESKSNNDPEHQRLSHFPSELRISIIYAHQRQCCAAASSKGYIGIRKHINIFFFLVDEMGTCQQACKLQPSNLRTELGQIKPSALRLSSSNCSSFSLLAEGSTATHQQPVRGTWGFLSTAKEAQLPGQADDGEGVEPQQGRRELSQRTKGLYHGASCPGAEIDISFTRVS